MSANGLLIREAALRYLDGEIQLTEDEPGLCLRVVREVVMNGLGFSYDDFYKHFYTHPVEDEPPGHRWARSVMRSLREQGRRVAYRENHPLIAPTALLLAELEPGDILASWKVGGPVGHITVLVTGGRNALMLDNTSTQRGLKISGFNRLSRVDERPFPESWESYRL